MTRVMSCRTVLVMISTLSALLLSRPTSESPAHGVAADSGPTTAIMSSGSAPVAGRIRHSSCSTSELRVRGGREGGGNFGYASVTAQFTNTADGPCRLRGTPRVDHPASRRHSTSGAVPGRPASNLTTGRRCGQTALGCVDGLELVKLVRREARSTHHRGSVPAPWSGHRLVRRTTRVQLRTRLP
jgi:hypothetical protein